MNKTIYKANTPLRDPQLDRDGGKLHVSGYDENDMWRRERVLAQKTVGSLARIVTPKTTFTCQQRELTRSNVSR